MLAPSLFAFGVVLYLVAVVVCWPTAGDPPWWAWPVVPLLFLWVKLWDERRTVALVVGVYGGAALVLFLGYRFNVFLLG
ncbi:hypothetical protein [Massilia sp. BKSP1R2A-1]|uniref:hypothetical protein n=1 Tax=Massilia sp. BKSP1R2A-1 TaxID=3422595 RepID=UPI003D33531F